MPKNKNRELKDSDIWYAVPVKDSDDDRVGSFKLCVLVPVDHISPMKGPCYQRSAMK